MMIMEVEVEADITEVMHLVVSFELLSVLLLGAQECKSRGYDEYRWCSADCV